MTTKKKFEDTKGVSSSRKSKDRQCNAQKKKNKRSNNVRKTLRRKLNIEQKEPHLNTGASEWYSSCTTCVTSRVTLVTNINTGT